MITVLRRLFTLGLLAYCASALTEVLVKLSGLQEAVERLDKPLKFMSAPLRMSNQEYADLSPNVDWTNQQVSKRGGPHPLPVPLSSASQETTTRLGHTPGSTGAGGRWIPRSGVPTEVDLLRPVPSWPVKETRTGSPTGGFLTVDGNPGPAPELSG